MKKGVYLIIGLLILTAGFFSSVGVDNTKAYHNSINISIGIDGTSQTIDTIVASNFVFPSHTYVSTLSLNPGHNANQTWVSVKDGEMNLLQSLSSTNKLCPASPLKTNYTSSPTDKSKPYHYASEISLSSGKNLQEAIDSGDFCYVWYTDTSSCSASCGGGTRTTYCTYKSMQVTDNYCYGTKPSVSCNTQGCIWIQTGSNCIPTLCSNVGGLSSCPSSPSGTACSPAGSVIRCGYPGGCGQAYGGCIVITYTCR